MKQIQKPKPKPQKPEEQDPPPVKPEISKTWWPVPGVDAAITVE